jgi:hypothetical protein
MPALQRRSQQSRLHPLLLAVGLATALPAAAAEIILYQHDDFRGRSYVADQTIANFANVDFDNRASSAIIRSGSWQLCADAYFRGRCVTLGPGEYPTLRSMALENQISSARELDWLGGGAASPGGRAELFDGNRFDGRVFAVTGPVSNFPREFNDRVQSMVVYGGHWELCENIDYRGTCRTYGPGRHADLGGMANRVSSIRPAANPAPGQGHVSGAGSGVDLFDGSRFEGRVFAVGGPVGNFPSEFNDRAQSMIVYDGYWEICENIDYRGTCQTYGPGRHASLGGMTNRASSIRPAADPGLGHGTVGWGSGARALLYEGPNLSGRSFVINTEVLPTLDGARFNDRAASLRVEGGYWLFCSDINFHGDCLTFGPGDYPTLPWSLNNRISSGRRIQEKYPYNQNPNWPR